ncbi:MAG: flagellin-like protein [Sphingomonas bacterium]|jgi:flagellar hook-associated protein 3 FlgL|nr:flagellin-like protein [Sphingomonas bacterium]MDB5690122.1 flagellin-like protein [Sphingomonas bacterium]
MISGTSTRISAEIARQSAMSRDIAKLQEQVSTGRKLTSPSEDPAGNAQLGTIRRSQADDAAFAVNTDAAAATATRADSAMFSLSTALDRVRELAVAARSATYSEGDRRIAAAELRSIADDITQMAAQKDSRGQPLFPEGNPLAIPIGEGMQVTATVSRAQLFGSGDAGLAGIVSAAADALELTDADARSAATATSLDAITAESDRVAQVHGEHGVRAARIDARREALSDRAITLTDERTAIEGADVSAAIALITAKLNTLEAAQSVFARLNRQNLFDILG